MFGTVQYVTSLSKDATSAQALALAECFAAAPGTIRQASEYAWLHRFETLPSLFSEVLSHTGSKVEEDLRFVARACARRMHFHFAYVDLSAFCRDAAYLKDELLLLLGHAVDSCLVEDSRVHWEALQKAADAGAAEGLGMPVFLHSAFSSPHLPADVLETAINFSSRLAQEGDVVGAYRKCSLLRRAGRFEEALLAIDAANSLVSSSENVSLAEHLSERLVLESQLALAFLDERKLNRKNS